KDGYDVSIDYVWGKPTELLLQAMTPGSIKLTGTSVRLVQAGEKAGRRISLPARTLRSSGVEILGGTKGMTVGAINEGTEQVWQGIREDKLSMEVEEGALKDIEDIWGKDAFKGKRVVLVP